MATIPSNPENENRSAEGRSHVWLDVKDYLERKWGGTFDDRRSRMEAGERLAGVVLTGRATRTDALALVGLCENIDPPTARLHYWSGIGLMALGQRGAALAAMHHANQADPGAYQVEVDEFERLCRG